MTKQIVFFGSSPFSVPVLERLLIAHCTVLGVVTTEDKPVGRHLKITPNPVKVLAQKYNIPAYESAKDFIENCPAKAGSRKCGDKLKIENSVGLVAAYGKIIPQEILDKFNGQIYNIHPSLLPKYRGPSPLQQQILDGVIDTGVSIIKIDALMDHGPIVAVAHDKILPDDTTITLGNRLFELGVNWIIENSMKIVNCKLKIQDESLATFTKKLTRQNGFLPWEQFNKLITDSIENHHDPRLLRAFYPWPGVWTLAPDGKRVKLNQVTPFLSRS